MTCDCATIKQSLYYTIEENSQSKYKNNTRIEGFFQDELRYSNYFSTGEAKRISQLPSGLQILNEDLTQDRDDRAGNAFIGLDFRPNEKTTLSASYSLYHQTNADLSAVNYIYSDDSDNLQRNWL